MKRASTTALVAREMIVFRDARNVGNTDEAWRALPLSERTSFRSLIWCCTSQIIGRC